MRPESIQPLLERGAARPSAKVDVGAILTRARRMHRHRMVSMIVAAIFTGGALAFAVANSLDLSGRVERETRPVPATAFPMGWTELPPPPEVREGAALVWTGSKLLAWGGCAPGTEDDCPPTSDGYVFDPSARTWDHMNAAPNGAVGADPVWTGREALFLDAAPGDSLEGQAYNPSTRAWRAIAPAPITARSGAVVVLTGTEVIVWGGGDVDDPTTRTGAAYQPESNSWRRMADAPFGLNLADGMWTGTEMLVFGSLLDGNNVAETKTSVGAAYSPASDTWREIPPSDLSPQATSAVWVGGRMIAWDYEPRSQEFDPQGAEWTERIDMPLDFSECYPDSAVVSGRVFAFYCGRAALYDNATSSWKEIHGGLLEEEVESGDKLWRFADLVSTGDSMLMLAEGITVTESGEPCYGCPGSPASFWAFRPPE